MIERLSAVLTPDPVVHVDNGLEEDRAAPGLTGWICVFTERFVAVADAVGVAPMHGHGGSGGGTVTISFAARASLARIEMAPGPGALNTAGTWSGEDARGGWPWAGRIGLVYPDLDVGVVLLPSAEQDAFAASCRVCSTTSRGTPTRGRRWARVSPSDSVQGFTSAI